MIADYLITSFATLMILLALGVTIFTAAHSFHVLIILILTISVLEYIESMMACRLFIFEHFPHSFC